MENKKVEQRDEELENLLAAYNEQTESDGRHAYSEVYHADYSDSCCCC